MRVNGARIHYEREGAGPPVVFLHAGVADSRMWEPQVADLVSLFLDGPERPRGYVAEPLRRLFIDMNGIAVCADFEKAPSEDPDPLAVRRLQEIDAPTLVVVGDKDVPNVLEAADLLMNSIPNVRKAVIHDAAHLPNLEHAEEFNRIVLDFLLAD